MSPLSSVLYVLFICVPFAAAAPADTNIVGDAARFKFYDMLTPLAGPCDLCTGPDGALWGEDIFANKIFRIDPKTDKVEELDIPFTLPALSNTTLPNIAGRTAFACAIRPGADGHIYAANGIRNQLVQVNVTSRAVRVLTPPPPNPLGDLQPFNDLYTGPHGMYFSQTTANVLTYFDYKTEKFTNHKVPTPLGSPLGVFVASDGMVYFAEFLGQKIGRLNPRTGIITEFRLPLSLLGPAVIRAETEGKYIWFTAFLGNALGRLDMRTGKVTAYKAPSPLSFPAEDTRDVRGNIWFSTATQNTLNKFNPSTRQFLTIRQPQTLIVAPLSLPFYFEIATHYGPGNAIWFTEATSNRVGRYQLL